MYPPYCTCCKGKCHWSSDWDASDLGYEHEGVIGLYTCSNCSIDFEIRDLMIDEKEVRSIKYYLPNIEDDNNNIDFNDIDINVNYCVYCKSILKEKTHYEKDNEYITIKRCDNCRADYIVTDECLIDIDDLNDIDYDNYLDESYNLYHNRTIVIE